MAIYFNTCRLTFPYLSFHAELPKTENPETAPWFLPRLSITPRPNKKPFKYHLAISVLPSSDHSSPQSLLQWTPTSDLSTPAIRPPATSASPPATLALALSRTHRGHRSLPRPKLPSAVTSVAASSRSASATSSPSPATSTSLSSTSSSLSQVSPSSAAVTRSTQDTLRTATLGAAASELVLSLLLSEASASSTPSPVPTAKISLLSASLEVRIPMITVPIGFFITPSECLISARSIAVFKPSPVFRMSNQEGLEAAVEAAVEFLNKAVKPVMVGGPKLRVSKASEQFVELANASGYPVAVMPSAKGMVPETHPRFIGIYWGAISTAFCAEIVESADAYIFVGPIFNDYSSVGYSLLLKKEKIIIILPDRVVIGNGPAYGCVLMDFLRALAKRVKNNPTAYENYERIFVPEGQPPKCQPMEPLRVNILFQHIQRMVSSDNAVIAETGDSWFNCQKLKLPEGCGYEFQMQYGSIGWSVGATLGYAQAATDKRVIAFIGDGSFQVTAQDVSTMIRCGQITIIFLINNGGYTIEVEIHDGPYNVIKNWNYTALVDAIHNGDGNCWTSKVKCEEELIDAIETATGPLKDCLCFIEIIVHKDDTSKELLEWGSRVSAANGRPPNPQ